MGQMSHIEVQTGEVLSCEVSCQSSKEPSDLGKESAPALPQMRNEVLPFDSVIGLALR